MCRGNAWVQGLYRIPGVKLRVEKLCADLESNPRVVNLDHTVRGGGSSAFIRIHDVE